MIKNAIKAVTLYTMTGLTIRRPTISKTGICWFSSIILPCFSFSDRRMQMSALSLTTIDATTQMRLSHITSPFFDLPAVSPTLLTIFTTLEGTSAMLEGTSTQLLTTFGDTRRMKRKHVSDETEAHAIRSGST